jgi:hypothetical protein
VTLQPQVSTPVNVGGVFAWLHGQHGDSLFPRGREALRPDALLEVTPVFALHGFGRFSE